MLRQCAASNEDDMSMSFYQRWQYENDRSYPGRNVVANCGPDGLYDLRGTVVYRIQKPTKRRLATAWPATGDDLKTLDWCVAHGCAQLELHAHTGVACGTGHQGTIVQDAYPTRVLYQATGRAG